MNKAWDEYDKLEEVPFESLKGKKLTSIEGAIGDEQMKFLTDGGDEYRLTYYDDCCASCTIEDICGDLNDLVGEEILLAEEVHSQEVEGPVLIERKKMYEEEKLAASREGREFYHYGPGPENNWKEKSETWTFYKISSIRGSVTIRWYGHSNGYYSETATFERVKHP